MTQFFKPIFASTFLALTLGGCSVAGEPIETTTTTEAQITKSTQAPTGYSKPSAAIDFQHDFSGRSTVGAVQTVNLKVMDRYPGGTVEISVVPSEGVTVFENGGQRAFNMGGVANNFQIQFQANSEGIHNITLIALAKLNDGQSITRSYAVPIYVGDQYQQQKQTAKNLGDNGRELQKQSDGSSLVIMEAEETIETSD